MIYITKSNGEREAFSDHKLLRSIKHVGIPHELAHEVLAHVKSKLYENIPTSEMHTHIVKFLEHSKMPYAKTKYSLKQAITDLGPTGYPFEDFIATIFQSQGFTTETRRILQGTCISHEIDVVATNSVKKIIVEAKFHNTSTIKTDVHVALYTKARFDDIKQRNEVDEIYLVTNTNLSTDAIAYAECVGIKLLSWNYPEQGGLRDLIEKYHLYPLTVLSSLTQTQKQAFFAEGIVLCRDICQDPALVTKHALPVDTQQTIIQETAFVCDRNFSL